MKNKDKEWRGNAPPWNPKPPMPVKRIDYMQVNLQTEKVPGHGDCLVCYVDGKKMEPFVKEGTQDGKEKLLMAVIQAQSERMKKREQKVEEAREIKIAWRRLRGLVEKEL